MSESGEEAALELMTTVAVCGPVVVGVKLTLIEQLWPAGKLEPQALETEKEDAFVPARAIPLIVRTALPVLLRDTILAVL